MENWLKGQLDALDEEFDDGAGVVFEDGVVRQIIDRLTAYAEAQADDEALDWLAEVEVYFASGDAPD